MSKKDYILLATALKNTKPQGVVYGKTKTDAQIQQWESTVEAITAVLTEDNPNFDSGRFRKACEGN